MCHDPETGLTFTLNCDESLKLCTENTAHEVSGSLWVYQLYNQDALYRGIKHFTNGT